MNAGFFAARADAPHWQAWSRRYAAAIARTGALVPHDQFALNHALHGDPIGGDRPPHARLLDPRCNWICDRGVPMWNDAEGAFCKPYPPFAAIGALLDSPAGRQTMGASARRRASEEWSWAAHCRGLDRILQCLTR